MKLLAFIFVLSIGLCSSMETKSQVVVVHDQNMTFTDADGAIHHSIRSKSITLPSGFLLKTATFQLPQDNNLVPDKGTKVIGMRFVLEYTDDENDKMIPIKFITDEKVDINHKGKFNVVMHLNGAGSSLPIGWYDPYLYE